MVFLRVAVFYIFIGGSLIRSFAYRISWFDEGWFGLLDAL